MVSSTIALLVGSLAATGWCAAPSAAARDRGRVHRAAGGPASSSPSRSTSSSPRSGCWLDAGLIVGHNRARRALCGAGDVGGHPLLRPRIEQVALSPGASTATMFRRVLLPKPAAQVFAAWIFALIASFDEVIVTHFIAVPLRHVPKACSTSWCCR